MAALTYSVAEAAAMLAIHRQTLYNRVSAREWPCTRMGRKIRFTPAQLEEILAICEQRPATKTPRRRKAS